MNTCQKNSGVSPKLINLIEEKVKNVNRIFNGTSKIVILSSTDDILYVHNRKAPHTIGTVTQNLYTIIEQLKMTYNT